MKGNTLTFILLIGFWMVLSERFTLETLILGLLLLLFLYMLYGRRKTSMGDKKVFMFREIRDYGGYLWLLVKEIVAANVQVAKIVLGPRISISPTLITYETKLRSKFHRTVFANSITLTPGTLTISLVDNILTIHCLKEEYGEQIIDSKLEKILLQIEEYQR